MKRFCYLALFLLVWSSLGACVPITPRPEQGIPEQGVSEQGTPETGEREAGAVEDLSANPDYILLTGLLGDIGAVIEDVNTRNELLQLQGLDNEENLITIELGDDLSDVLSELFEIEPKDNVEEQGLLTIARIFVMTNEGFPVEFPGVDPRQLAIEQVRLASTLLYEDPDNPISLPVYAELDLATALAGNITIDPNSIGAHASGPPVSASGGVDLFWNQWALGPEGVGLFSVPGDVASHPGCPSNSGSLVTPPKVVVFDTVPITLTDSISLPTLVQIPLGEDCVRDLDLTVSEVVAASAPSIETKEYHGVYASALVHAAAPESEIHLVRVMESDGTGYVFDLLRGIMDETNRTAFDIASGAAWTPTIFNFSLGIHPDAKLIERGRDNEIDAAQLIYGIAVNADLFRETPLVETDPEMGAPTFLHPETELAVQLVVWATRRAGIIMVAASGNDGNGEQYPAAFAPVLGVGAYGWESAPTKACYSNLGDIYAPGGGSTVMDGPPCDPEFVTQCILADCPDGVVSVIGWSNNWQMAFWNGTSFAAPLASGMVALRLYNSTSMSGGSSDLVDTLVSHLRDTGNCPGHQIDGHCKLNLDQVLAVP